MKAIGFTETKYGLRINIKAERVEAPVIKSLPWDLTKRAWNPDVMMWQVTAIPETLILLKEIKCEISPEVEKEISGKQELLQEKLEASKSTQVDIDIPSPEGLQYRPFQKAGIAYCIKNPNTLIADEMGLGKTIQAIGVININENIKRVLVVCPASLKLNWRNELVKWLVRPMNVQILSSKDREVTGDVVIVNYDILHKFVQVKVKKDGKFVMKGEDLLPEFDLLIADESHFAKSSKALRTKALQAAAKKSERRILLTGTPIKNRPVELFTQINLLNPEEFPSFWKFAHRYCGATNNGYGWDFTGSSNIEELYTRLRTTCMVRRLKKDVLKELPAKVRQIIELPADGNLSLIKEEQKAFNDKQTYLETLHVALELAKASDDEAHYQDTVRQLREGYTAAFTEMAKIRKETAIAKVPYVISHIEDVIEDDEKVVVFAHHREVCNAIHEHFGSKSVILTGAIPKEVRQRVVDRFQEDDNVKVFVGSLHAAGIGFTLTASSRVVFAEFDWTPAIMQQAEDRAHRIGQEENVLIQYLVLEGSIDSKIARDIADKLSVIELALDKGKGIMRVDPAIEEAKNDIAEVVEVYTTKQVKRAQIEKEAVKLTLAQIKEVHGKLKELAAMCDGANQIDGAGFNKIDTGIGKSLAYSLALTPKQAVLGFKIANKYRRQVGEMSFSL